MKLHLLKALQYLDYYLLTTVLSFVYNLLGFYCTSVFYIMFCLFIYYSSN